MIAAETGIEVGSVLDGKYRIEGAIGRGGMGTVYRARHLALNEAVAIKILRPDAARDEEIVARFTREAQWAVKLRSEHVARIHDVGTTDDGLPFMVMEFLEGADLGQLVEQNGAMFAPIAIDLLLQACDAMAEAHSLGIVHRDIKPSNLYVSFRPDQTAIVKVLDFGISKAGAQTDLSLTQTQSMLGTPAYMSPEQMRSARDVDMRTDIWSLGTVLYELVEGQRPFAAESFSEMCVMVAVDPPRPMTLAPELSAIIMRCLEKQPAARYANVAELMSDLAGYAYNPDAARYYVTRAHRVLGRDSTPVVARPSMQNIGTGPVPKVPRHAPGSGPVQLLTPPAMPIAALTMHKPGAPPPTFDTTALGGTTRRDSSAPSRRGRGVWIGALLALLVGVGSAVAYVAVTTESTANDRGVDHRSIDDRGSSSERSSDLGAALPVDAAVESSAVDAAIAAIPDAGAETPTVGRVASDSAGSATGSATQTATLDKPPIRKPPIRKPPVRKPPEVKKPEVKKPPEEKKPPEVKPPKKCDPFDARVKC